MDFKLAKHGKTLSDDNLSVNREDLTQVSGKFNPSPV